MINDSMAIRILFTLHDLALNHSLAIELKQARNSDSVFHFEFIMILIFLMLIFLFLSSGVIFKPLVQCSAESDIRFVHNVQPISGVVVTANNKNALVALAVCASGEEPIRGVLCFLLVCSQS